MDSEPGPGDVSRHVPGLCCLLTLGRLMKREGEGEEAAPPRLRREPAHGGGEGQRSLIFSTVQNVS